MGNREVIAWQFYFDSPILASPPVVLASHHSATGATNISAAAQGVQSSQASQAVARTYGASFILMFLRTLEYFLEAAGMTARASSGWPGKSRIQSAGYGTAD
jgi:hypothetical protein